MKRNYIGICLIGAGRAGMMHARNYKSRIPYAKIVAVADPSEESLKNACSELEIAKGFLDYNEALSDEDIDAVVVVSPTKYHKEIVVAAAKSKKHIFCEKPMAMDVNECEEMIAAARDNDVILQIGFMRRFDSSYMSAKELIEKHEIGDVVLVKSNTRGPSHPQPWMYDIGKSNGPLAEVNSHDIDTLRWFTGSEFKSVYAIGGNYRCPEAKGDYPDFYDNVAMIGSFENGMQGMIDGSLSVKYGYDAKVEVVGTEGVITIGRLDGDPVVVCNKRNGMVRPPMDSWRTLFKDAYIEEDKHFVNCILNEQTPKVTGHDGKMAVKVVKAGNLSIVEKRIVIL